MLSWINYNGEIIPSTTAQFSFGHSAIHSSEILEERIRLYNDDLLFAERHYFHLMAQMRMARMHIPLEFTPEFFYDAIERLQSKLEIRNAEFSFYVTQNEDTIDYWISAQETEDNLVAINQFEIELYRESHVDNSFLNRINFLRPQHRILKTYAEENHMDDLILLNNQKSVAHTIYGNIFMVMGTQLFTPALENGAYDDVWRDRIITASKRMPHFDEVIEGELFPFKLTKADELFIVLNGQGIIPISKFRKTTYQNDSAEEISNYLLELA